MSVLPNQFESITMILSDSDDYLISTSSFIVINRNYLNRKFFIDSENGNLFSFEFPVGFIKEDTLLSLYSNNCKYNYVNVFDIETDKRVRVKWL